MTDDNFYKAKELKSQINSIKDFLVSSEPLLQPAVSAGCLVERTTTTKLIVFSLSQPIKTGSEVVVLPDGMFPEIVELMKNKLTRLEQEYEQL